MDLEKVRSLSDAGRFDLCSSCTTPEYRQKYTEDTLTQATLGGIFHAHISDGRTSPIFKTLLANACTHDCNYCTNSTTCTKKSKKSMYKPVELAKVFHHLLKNNKVEGLFLSSGIVKNADHTTEMMIDTVKIIRNQLKFRGYIHFKALPGVSFDLLKQARQYTSRMSINIEATDKEHLNNLTSIKDYKSDLLKRQLWIKRLNPKSGQTTQMVIGASGETDWDVMKMMKWEYEEMALTRMYYSGFTPVKHTNFENKQPAAKWRPHRLYNIDWLFRKYKYQFNELKELLNDDGMLPDEDPKLNHARKFLTKPVDINEASREELLRVPGIGPKTASRIVKMREFSKRPLKRVHLNHTGAILKRADPFIKVDGWTQRSLSSF